MKVALLGGTFNPPHIGHVMIARQVLDFTDTDEVWFLPNYGQHPEKPNVASVSDRVSMVSMITLQKTRISTLEINNKLDGNTIHLLPFLPKEHRYHFIIGSDWLSRFHTWGNYQELLEKLPFFVFPRYGHSIEPLYKNMTVVSHPTLVSFDISCTKIRERVKLGFSIDNFVPAGVGEYIKTHKLYL